MRIAAAHPERQVREALRRALLAGSGNSVLWMASDQAQAREACNRDTPDLLLLDVSLAGSDAAWVRELVKGDICAVMMLADDPDRAVAGIYEALGHGALGVAYPPSVGAEGQLNGATQLLARIERVATLVRRHSPNGTPSGRAGGLAPTGRLAIVALGASTGGPQALSSILNALPRGLNAAVIIVQHIEAEFFAGLAQWLSKSSSLPVCLAKRGQEPQAGVAYLADGTGHLVYLPSGHFSYLSGHRDDLHVPSVDMLFNSLAENAPAGAAALLTGMGADGANGLLKMRQKGWLTIAQDESSSAVFGMPRAAIQIGAASRILDVSGIPTVLSSFVSENLPRSTALKQDPREAPATPLPARSNAGWRSSF